MKQAKFALTAVAILAVIGGALAFKANRGNVTFYQYTTTWDAANNITGACIPTVVLHFTPNALGTLRLTSVSSARVTGFSTCTARVLEIQ